MHEHIIHIPSCRWFIWSSGKSRKAIVKNVDTKWINTIEQDIYP